MHTEIIKKPRTFDHHMPCSVTSDSSRKRRQPEDPYDTSRRLSKRQKPSWPAPAYWDNLSRIWLTKRALKELDRRNGCVGLPQKRHQPFFSRPLHREPKKHREPSQLVPDLLGGCSPACLKQIKKFSRLGDPDLSDLRNVRNY